MDQDALAAYRRRIGDDGPIEPNEATLRRLHRRHVLSVPFENLDVMRRVPVSVEPAAAFAKIVERGRGGWCFEMNGLFGEALRAVGFRVDLLGATVGQSEPGELNHLALLVHLDAPWLADVGFGFSPLEPIPLREGETEFAAGTFRVARSGDVWSLEKPGDGLGYVFTTQPRERTTFEPANLRLQSDPASPFTSGPFVARALEDGYVCLRNADFVRRSRGDTVEQRALVDRDELRTLLVERFGLNVDLELDSIETAGRYR